MSFKKQTKITAIALVALLAVSLISIATAAPTANKDLPTKTEVINFINSQSSNNFIKKVSETSAKKHPTWKWDIWKGSDKKQLISFYYTNPSSKKGYESIYYNNQGTKTTPKCDIKYQLVKSYQGED
jgi:hypothetical protein